MALRAACAPSSAHQMPGTRAFVLLRYFGYSFGNCSSIKRGFNPRTVDEIYAEPPSPLHGNSCELLWRGNDNFGGDAALGHCRSILHAPQCGSHIIEQPNWTAAAKKPRTQPP